MGSKRKNWFIGPAAAALVLLLSGDALTAPRGRGRGPAHGFGPPAHARAYGHRNKVVHGLTLIFDSTCGLYVVVGLTDCYYYGGRFYRWRGGVWEISLRTDTWEPVGHDKLPAAVHLKIKSSAKYNSSGQGNAKPNGNANREGKPDNGASGAKPNAGGSTDPEPNPAAGSAAKAKADGNGPAKTSGTGATQPATSAGSPVRSPAPTASGSSPAKSKNNGAGSAQSSGKSGGGSSKPKSSGKGKR